MRIYRDFLGNAVGSLAVSWFILRVSMISKGWKNCSERFSLEVVRIFNITKY